MRRPLLLLALIATASSLAVGQTKAVRVADSQSDARGAAARCLSRQLSVSHVADDAAMGGSRLVDYAFTNTSSTPCTLFGYPRFVLLDKSGRPLRGGRAVHSDQLPDGNLFPRLTTLEPGKTAWFRIHYNSGGAGYVGKPCPSSEKVRITAPGTKRAFVLREGITLCRRVRISAVQNGLPR